MKVYVVELGAYSEVMGDYGEFCTVIIGVYQDEAKALDYVSKFGYPIERKNRRGEDSRWAVEFDDDFVSDELNEYLDELNTYATGFEPTGLYVGEYELL